MLYKSDGEASSAPAEHAPTDRIHLVNGKPGREQRFGEIRHVRLRTIGVTDGLRQGGDRCGTHRGGATGQQDQHDAALVDAVRELIERIGSIEGRGPGHGMIADHERDARRQIAADLTTLRLVGGDDESTVHHALQLFEGIERTGHHGRRGFPECDHVHRRAFRQRRARRKPGVHGVARARKRRRALHRGTIQCREQGAGMLRGRHERNIANDIAWMA